MLTVHVGGLVLQEIVSYIKGSAEAMDSPEGHLSLKQYLDVGRKRAPNFSSELREKVRLHPKKGCGWLSLSGGSLVRLASVLSSIPWQLSWQGNSAGCSGTRLLSWNSMPSCDMRCLCLMVVRCGLPAGVPCV
jgi:hypothetical protein